MLRNKVVSGILTWVKDGFREPLPQRLTRLLVVGVDLIYNSLPRPDTVTTGGFGRVAFEFLHRDVRRTVRRNFHDEIQLSVGVISITGPICGESRIGTG